MVKFVIFFLLPRTTVHQSGMAGTGYIPDGAHVASLAELDGLTAVCHGAAEIVELAVSGIAAPN